MPDPKRYGIVKDGGVYHIIRETGAPRLRGFCGQPITIIGAETPFGGWHPLCKRCDKHVNRK